jgi:hypothetical protein
MRSNALDFVAAGAGVAGGLVSQASFLAGQWLNLVVWAVAGLLLGLFARGRRQIVGAGVVYGVALSVVFLLAGFHGTPDKLPGFLLLTAALCVVGALGGLATVAVGAWLRRLVARTP